MRESGGWSGGVHGVMQKVYSEVDRIRSRGGKWKSGWVGARGRGIRIDR